MNTILQTKTYLNKWTHKGKEIESISDIPSDKKYIGFIYLITQKSTGRKYIGRKLLESTSTKAVGGKKKKIKKESDWKSYWSSSPWLKEYIKEHGVDDFTREILVFVSSKSELMYAEEYCLYISDALLSENWFNENIRAKVMKSWFKAKKDFITDVHYLREKIYK